MTGPADKDDGDGSAVYKGIKKILSLALVAGEVDIVRNALACPRMACAGLHSFVGAGMDLLDDAIELQDDSAYVKMVKMHSVTVKNIKKKAMKRATTAMAAATNYNPNLSKVKLVRFKPDTTLLDALRQAECPSPVIYDLMQTTTPKGDELKRIAHSLEDLLIMHDAEVMSHGRSKRVRR
jgi:hypothetical protein